MISNVSLANSTLFDLKMRADAGDVVAQNSLGHIYLYGNEELNVSVFTKEILNWFSAEYN